MLKKCRYNGGCDEYTEEDWLSKAEEWKGIKSVLEVCRKRSDNGKESQEKVFYISSLDVDIQILA
ncbi:hypothetical protein Q7447_12740, partial [Glaesserella parasuis]|nr:hypothetical protein [Glaesserella parasuis]